MATPCEVPIYEIGCQVKTPYGYGNVIQVISPQKLCIEFDEWKLAGGNHPRMFTTPTQILYGSSYDLGTFVLTRYGPGLLIGYQRLTNIHVVRLWRPRGLGSATAYLNQSDVLQKLAGFPGMKVVTSYGAGMLEGYSNGKYIVKLGYGTAYLNEAAILSCPEAKVFPTAECLADQALSKLKSLNWGDSFLSGPTAPITNAMTTFWERVRNGETQIDDALAERAKQINDHLTGLDLQEMHKSLQDRVESIVSEPGKIEMLLAEGKQRILQLIDSADQRTVSLPPASPPHHSHRNDYLKVALILSSSHLPPPPSLAADWERATRSSHREGEAFLFGERTEVHRHCPNPRLRSANFAALPFPDSPPAQMSVVLSP
jgi:hypothetical protein